jgi:ATP-dependent Lhr-like helicase
VVGAYLALAGGRVAAVAERSGKHLRLDLSPEDPALEHALAFLKVMLGRQVQPVRSLTVDTINGEPAAGSPYRRVLEGLAHVVSDGRSLRLMRRY